jgi:hypothetical protein
MEATRNCKHHHSASLASSQAHESEADGIHPPITFRVSSNTPSNRSSSLLKFASAPMGFSGVGLIHPKIGGGGCCGDVRWPRRVSRWPGGSMYVGYAAVLFEGPEPPYAPYLAPVRYTSEHRWRRPVVSSSISYFETAKRSELTLPRLQHCV